MNKIIVMGRLVRDPELKASGAGTEYCHFTVACDRAFSKKGEDKKTDFIDCTTFGKSAAFVEKYFHKGDGIAVEGRMESNKWVDQDGKNRVSWGVTVDRVEFPSGRKGQTDPAQDEPIQSGSTFAEPSDGDDSDIPF